MKVLPILLVLLFPVFGFCQESRLAVHPRAILSAGILGGEAEPEPAYQLSAGLAFGRYFAGAGIGLDRYKFRSMPLFADLRVGLGRSQSVFLYGNAGYHFATENGMEPNDFLVKDEYLGGFFMDAGAGYRFPLGRMSRILVSAGYSRKNMRHEQATKSYCPSGNCPDVETVYIYKLGRMAFKLSWEFGR
jgi:hypothetical protein